MIRRVLRGGSFNYDSRYLRTTDRYSFLPVNRLRLYGFRLVVRRG